jgi:endonuclease/exonuclease/phosphatase (EEP) superfamily protein YafD
MIISKKPTEFGLSILVIFSGYLFLNPPSLLFKILQSAAFQYMAGNFVLGLFLLIKGRKILSTSFFICFTSLAFMIGTSTTQLSSGSHSMANLKVAHFNVLYNNHRHSNILDEVWRTNADLLSFQEVSEEWSEVLIRELSHHYPYYRVAGSNTYFGLAVFSKTPFNNIRVDSSARHPIVIGEIEVDNQAVNFLCAHTTSPITRRSYLERNQELELISDSIHELGNPVLLIGDLNSVPWDKNLRRIIKHNKLKDSRRFYSSTFPRILGFFGIPIDYILYSNNISCTKFETLSSSSSDHKGIYGEYAI